MKYFSHRVVNTIIFCDPEVTFTVAICGLESYVETINYTFSYQLRGLILSSENLNRFRMQ